MKKSVLTTLVLIVLFCSSLALAHATDPNTYTITKTSPADPINPGSTVTMTAGTSNILVNTVVFEWYAPGDYPAGPIAYTSTDSTPSDGFTSSLSVSANGEWTVVATFGRVLLGQDKIIYADPITWHFSVGNTFFVVPEYPLIGSAGVFIAMLLGLIVFKRKEISNQIRS
jgi:hypothetical protein